MSSDFYLLQFFWYINNSSHLDHFLCFKYLKQSEIVVKRPKVSFLLPTRYKSFFKCLSIFNISITQLKKLYFIFRARSNISFFKSCGRNWNRSSTFYAFKELDIRWGESEIDMNKSTNILLFTFYGYRFVLVKICNIFIILCRTNEMNSHNYTL